MNRQIHYAFFSPKTAFIFVALLSLALHWRVFSLDLIGQHVWRQTETQLNIRHFAKDDFNIFNPRTNYLEKPDGINRLEFPLMQWCIAALDRVLGYSILLTRIFLFVMGLITVLGIMKLARIIFSDTRAPAIAAWTFSFSPLFYYYTMNPIPDMMAICAACWGIAFGLLWVKEKKAFSLLLSGIFLAIAALTKLPFILYFVIFPCYWWQNRKEGLFIAMFKSIYGWIFIVVPIAWYAAVMSQWNDTSITNGLFSSQIHIGSKHFRDLWANFTSILPELLINYGAIPFFIAGIFFLLRNKFFNHPFFFYLAITGICVLAYFIYELHLISTNHDYYLLPFLPLIFMIITFGAVQLLIAKPNAKIIVVLLLCILPITAFLRIDSRWNIHHPGFNPDLLVYAEEIKKIIPEKSHVITANDPSGQIWFYYLDRSGWNFYNDSLDQSSLKEYTKNTAYYFVCDSRKLERQVAASGKLGAKQGTFGSINVYKLLR